MSNTRAKPLEAGATSFVSVKAVLNAVSATAVVPLGTTIGGAVVGGSKSLCVFDLVEVAAVIDAVTSPQLADDLYCFFEHGQTQVGGWPTMAQDLLATLCLALGIDYLKTNPSNIGRPIRIVDQNANPMKEVTG